MSRSKPQMELYILSNARCRIRRPPDTHHDGIPNLRELGRRSISNPHHNSHCCNRQYQAIAKTRIIRKSEMVHVTLLAEKYNKPPIQQL